MLPSLPLAMRSVVYLFLSWIIIIIIIILCVFLTIKQIKKIIKSCYKSLIVKLMATRNEYFASIPIRQINLVILVLIYECI